MAVATLRGDDGVVNLVTRTSFWQDIKPRIEVLRRRYRLLEEIGLSMGFIVLLVAFAPSIMGACLHMSLLEVTW